LGGFNLRVDCECGHPTLRKRALLPIILTLYLSSCGKPAAEYKYEAIWRKAPELQVVLLKDAKTARLALHAPYRLVNMNSGKTLLRGNGLGETSVSFSGSAFILGRESFRAAGVKLVCRRDGAVELNGTRYRGEVSLVAAPLNRLKALNRLSVEEYIRGVLGSEMPNYWDKEALMAQAICIRTYALDMKMSDKKLSSLHLAYRGTTNENWRLDKIVEETKGIVMFYKGSLFPAYFHSTCGGHTEDAAQVFGNKGLAPLSGVECGFCGKSKYYQWEADINKADIEEKLKKKYPVLKGVSAVVPANPGPGGHSSTVMIKHAGGELKMGANQFRLLVGPNVLYSTAFSARESGPVIKFTGSGWGHGVGMCQYGAEGMAEKGAQWYQILRHYYPGVEFVKVYQ
jgi:stage II sporulation protein D